MSNERRAISELAALELGAAVTIAGRVIARDDASALLADETGACPLRGALLPALHALSMVEGVWSGSEVRTTRVMHEQPGAARAPAESETWALSSRARLKHKRLVARSQIMGLVRSFFASRGFLEVETPLAVPSPGLDVHLDAVRLDVKGEARYLVTSPEYQMKRLLAGGLERIVQIGKCFRNDEVGERHQPEFTMLEWYRAWAGADDVMRDTEELVAHVARELSGKPVLRTAKGEVDVTPPWPRITVREAFAWFCGLDSHEVAQDEALFYQHMVGSVEPALESVGAVFLCEYPASMASLARKKPGDPRVAERFEAYVAGVELCNGFGELTDPVEQRERLLRDQAARTALGLPVYPLDARFLAALEEGMPPSGGNALGLDRLIMLALGAEHIEDVIAVPASRL